MPDLLRPSEAADRLGVSRETLRRYADSGRVPAERTPGGHHRYRNEDLERLRAEARENARNP